MTHQTIPNIALVGNAPADKCDMLNAMLTEEELAEVCYVTLYGADGQPEIEALNDALLDWKEDKVQAIVCLPLAEELQEALRRCMGEEADNILPLHVSSQTRLASVTHDVDIEEASALLTPEVIISFCKKVADSLRHDFFIRNPRLLLTTLSDELILDESSAEMSSIAPAINALSKEGIMAFGPMLPDKVMRREATDVYDVVIQMYDTQCSEDFLDNSSTSIMTIMSNIEPVIVATDYEGVITALFTAIDIMRNRDDYMYPFANPLPKLYHERKEDSDKARFAVKKKGFNPAEHRRENVNYTSVAKKDDDQAQ